MLQLQDQDQQLEELGAVLRRSYSEYDKQVRPA
jgi:hypothetical protein